MQLTPPPPSPAGSDAGGAAPGSAARTVRCPSCRQPALYAPSNPHRPFCSARCRGLDLGAWATEDYRVPATPPADADDPGAA